jgi:hypothetical protein
MALKHTNTTKKFQGILLLCKNKPLGESSNLNTKEIVERSQIFDSKVRPQILDQASRGQNRGAHQDDIINVDQEETKVSTPRMRSLLKTIYGVDHATKMIQLGGILKTRRLMHVHFLFENTMKECILNIKLAKIPSIGNSHGEK